MTYEHLLEKLKQLQNIAVLIAEERYRDGFADGQEQRDKQWVSEHYKAELEEKGYQRGYDDGIKDKKMDLPVSWDDAYQRGYEDGVANTPFTDTEKAEKSAYQRGLEDAWKCAKDITEMSSAEMTKIFGEAYQSKIFEKFTAAEAMQKIKDYEERREAEIEKAVNERIKNISVNTGVNFYDDLQEQQEERSCKNCFADKQNCSFINECIPNNRKYWKTQKWGNHIYEEICLFAEDEGCSVDEIATVLDKMRGDSND